MILSIGKLIYRNVNHDNSRMASSFSRRFAPQYVFLERLNYEH